MAERADELLDAIRVHPFVLDKDHSVNETVSLGVAPTEADDLPSLYKAADAGAVPAEAAGAQPGRRGRALTGSSRCIDGVRTFCAFIGRLLPSAGHHHRR